MTDSPASPRNSGAEGRPTLRTVAKLAGLAVTTVSRALNDAPDIGEKTKIKVRRIAKEVGYRPNRAGVRLRTGKTNVISLVLSTEENVMNHTAQLIYSISDTLRGSPYHMIVTPYSSGDDPMDPIRYIVETGSADGVIINQVQPDDPRVKYMIERDFPFVTHGRTDCGLDHPYFDFDNSRFSEVAVEALAARGRRRLILVSPPRDQTYARDMTRGFSETADRLGCSHFILENVTSDSPVPNVVAAVKQALSQDPGIDGIVVGSTSAAMAVVAALEDVGRTLGRDIDVAAKEAVEFLHFFRKGIIVVHEDVALAGRMLARGLISAIERQDTKPLQQLQVPRSLVKP